MNAILKDVPNAIILDYHGNGEDPFHVYPGSSIKRILNLEDYPAGTIDRVNILPKRDSWPTLMNNRKSVPATVGISMTGEYYNKSTRNFIASIDFTALQPLDGQFKFNVILVENGIVWLSQDYFSNWTVRSMMNGPLGEKVINGSWAQGQIINKTVSLEYPVPPAVNGINVPDIVPENCQVVVLVYKVGSPFYSNSKIQQAIQDVFYIPNYWATIEHSNTDIIVDNSTPAVTDAWIHNKGKLTDKYGMNVVFDGPAGWTAEYSTENGTFTTGQVDSVEVKSGDSTHVIVTITPNGNDGSGSAVFDFSSSKDLSASSSVSFKIITTTGFDVLAVNDGSDSENYITNSLNNVFTGTYGVVSRSALQQPGVDISNFKVIAWSSGQKARAFYQIEVNTLQTFLDNGGRLFITGQDIGSDIFESTGKSQFAKSFYNNYLHANYLRDAIFDMSINGYAGDPISDGLSFKVAYYAGITSLEGIAPYDVYASPIFKYGEGPNIGAIKVATNNYRVVYLGIGFESIPTSADRDTIMARSLLWLQGELTGIKSKSVIPLEFSLNQNYPNPFNPGTNITYSLASQSEVSLKIYNNLGQEIRTLVNNLSQPVDKYSVYWDGKDNYGNLISSGVYFYHIVINSDKLFYRSNSQIFEQSKKMLLIK